MNESHNEENEKPTINPLLLKARDIVAHNTKENSSPPVGELTSASAMKTNPMEGNITIVISEKKFDRWVKYSKIHAILLGVLIVALTVFSACLYGFVMGTHHKNHGHHKEHGHRTSRIGEVTNINVPPHNTDRTPSNPEEFKFFNSIRKDDIPEVLFSLDSGNINLNLVEPYTGQNALHVAVQSHDPKMVEIIINREPNPFIVNERDNLGRTPLRTALSQLCYIQPDAHYDMNPCFKIVQILRANGAHE